MFCLANPDFADILGDVDLNFESFYFPMFLDYPFLDFQVPRFPKSGPGRAGPGLSRCSALAGLLVALYIF